MNFFLILAHNENNNYFTTNNNEGRDATFVCHCKNYYDSFYGLVAHFNKSHSELLPSVEVMNEYFLFKDIGYSRCILCGFFSQKLLTNLKRFHLLVAHEENLKEREKAMKEKGEEI